MSLRALQVTLKVVTAGLPDGASALFVVTGQVPGRGTGPRPEMVMRQRARQQFQLRRAAPRLTHMTL
jgi:hypothetical protein